MAIILDADVIIRSEKGEFDLISWVESQAAEIEIAAITIAELWHGVERATGVLRREREEFLQNLVVSLPIIPYTEEIAYEHARIWAELSIRGKMIGLYDLIVAATALHRNSSVATFNKKHFSVISGLKVIQPD